MGNKTNITLITGYLGSGKTTLLNHILNNARDIRAAVIVNDVGEVNIDAALLEKEGNLKQEDLIPLTNGCICCTLKEDLSAGLARIAGYGKFDHIIIEASGICEPMPIAHTIARVSEELSRAGSEMQLDNVITVLDAKRTFDEFAGGKDWAKHKFDEDDIQNLLIEQLEFCNTVLLNKVDLITAEQLAELHATVRALQRDAKIFDTVNCAVSPELLLDTNAFQLEKTMASAAWLETAHAHSHEHEEEHEGEHEEEHEEKHAHHSHEEGHNHVLEYGIETFVYYRRKPFTRERMNALAEEWFPGVIRTKGTFWYEEEPDMSYIFSQSGRQITEKQAGPFLASAPKEQQQAVLARFPQVKAIWDEKVGDRMVKLVFIGKGMNRKAIEKRLDESLADQ